MTVIVCGFKPLEPGVVENVVGNGSWQQSLLCNFVTGSGNIYKDREQHSYISDGCSNKSRSFVRSL